MPALFRQSIVGASVSDRSVELAEVRRVGAKAFELRACARAALAPGIVEGGRVLDVDRLGKAIREAARTARPAFRASRVSAAIPDAATYFHLFRLPGSLNDAEVAGALAFQLEEIVPLPVDDLVGARAVVSRSAAETVALEAVASRDAVAPFARAAQRAGFDVAFLPMEAEASAAALVGVPRAGHATLVADVGARATVLVVRDSLGLRGTFSKPFAGEVMTDALAAGKRLTREKAEALKCSVGFGPKADEPMRRALRPTIAQIAREIRRVADWYREVEPTGRIDEIVLTGGSAQMPGLLAELAAALRSERWAGKARIGDPFVRLRDSAAARAVVRARQRSVYAPAVGAALLAFDGPTFDFRGAPAVRQAKPARFSRPSGTARDTFSYVSPQTKLIAAVAFVAVSFLGLGVVVFQRFLQIPPRSMSDVPVSSEQTAGSFVRQLAISTDPTMADVPARAVGVESFPVSVFVTPSESVERDAVATGTVVLTNRTDVDQPLVATTRLLSAGGVLFRLRDSVVVPANGSTEAAVYAAEAGASGNVPPTSFVVPGLPTALQESVYAESAAPMTGGVARVGVLTQADVDAAIATATEEAAQSVQAVLSDLIGADETVRPELTRTSLVSYSMSDEVGSEVARATVTAVYRVDALAYRPSDLLAAVAADAGSGLSAEVRDLRARSFDPDQGSASVSVFGNYYVSSEP